MNVEICHDGRSLQLAAAVEEWKESGSPAEPVLLRMAAEWPHPERLEFRVWPADVRRLVEGEALDFDVCGCSVQVRLPAYLCGRA